MNRNALLYERSVVMIALGVLLLTTSCGAGGVSPGTAIESTRRAKPTAPPGKDGTKSGGKSKSKAPEITYGGGPHEALVGTAFGPVLPDSTGGDIDEFVAVTALPSGVSLDTTTGAISGEPTSAVPSTDYVIRAIGPGGSDEATLRLAVSESLGSGLRPTDLWGPVPASIGHEPNSLPNVGQKTVTGFKSFGNGRTNQVLIEGDALDGEYVADQSDTEYVLQGDMTSPTFGILVAANDVTVNLNGHTITYQTVGLYNNDRYHTFGVGTTGYYERGEIVNGRIVQGDGAGSGDTYGRGCNPICAQNANRFLSLIAGVHAEYRSDDTGGFYLPGDGGVTVEFCSLVDQGTVVTDRHRALSAIKIGSNGIVRDTTIQDCRQVGVAANGSSVTVERCEIRVDSRATNAYAVGTYDKDGLIVRGCNLYGLGEHGYGVGIHSGAQDCLVEDNWMETQITRTSTEYGWSYGPCISVRWGTTTTENVYRGNVCIAYSEDNGPPNAEQSRGKALWIGALEGRYSERFEDNVFACISLDGTTEGYAADLGSAGDYNVTFTRDRFLGTHTVILCGGSYTTGEGWKRLTNCVLEKEGASAEFATIRNLLGGCQLELASCTTAGGASLNDVVTAPGAGPTEIVTTP